MENWLELGVHSVLISNAKPSLWLVTSGVPLKYSY